MNDKRKRILLVHSTLHVGGAEEVSANICRRIDRDLFDVHACVLKENGVVGRKVESEGTMVHSLTIASNAGPDYWTWWRLRKLIRAEAFDLIHSHDLHAMVDSAICRLSNSCIKHVHTFHFGNYPYRSKEAGRLERPVWRIPDSLVAVSEHQRKGIMEQYNIPDDRIVTIWNGVDVLPPVEPHELLKKFTANRIVIGSVNTLIEQKGMPELVRVARLLKDRDVPEFVFLVAGGGWMLKELRQLVDKLDVANEVVFLDWVEDAARCVLPHVDIFFQPSNWEAMSIVLLEAMALGRPIVATDVGETPRIIRDHENGMLVPRGDVESMAGALHELIRDSSLREMIALQAVRDYQEEFTARSMAERYEKHYRSLLL